MPTVYLDYDRHETLVAALRGADRVFMATGCTIRMFHQSRDFLNAARTADVEHIVHLGAPGDDDTPVEHWRWHQFVERYIEWSGFSFTRLRPQFFMQTLLEYISGRVRLEQAPNLAAPTISGVTIAFTRLQCADEEYGRAGPAPVENSFAFPVMLQPLQSWELLTARGRASLPPTGPGDVFLFDLSEYPRIELHDPFDMVRFYVLQCSLNSLAYERGLRRVGGLQAPRSGTHDPVMHGLAMSLTASMVGPNEAQALFGEHIALAFYAQAAHAYGECRKVAALTVGWRRGS